jgi:hypothetical protein
MKITITAIAAMFSLMMLIAPVRASAEVSPFPIQQVGYVEQVGYWHHYHPLACSNHYFRRHHWRMCH